MIAFFGIVAVVCLMWLLLELAAKANSAAPSMVRMSGNGWVLVLIGVVGAICVRFAQ